jgi:hypothetical protein
MRNLFGVVLVAMLVCVVASSSARGAKHEIVKIRVAGKFVSLDQNALQVTFVNGKGATVTWNLDKGSAHRLARMKKDDPLMIEITYPKGSEIPSKPSANQVRFEPLGDKKFCHCVSVPCVGDCSGTCPEDTSCTAILSGGGFGWYCGCTPNSGR